MLTHKQRRDLLILQSALENVAKKDEQGKSLLDHLEEYIVNHHSIPDLEQAVDILMDKEFPP